MISIIAARKQVIDLVFKIYGVPMETVYRVLRFSSGLEEVVWLDFWLRESRLVLF